MLAKEQIENYQQLYKKHLGIDISYNQAYDELLKLVHLAALVYGIPITLPSIDTNNME